MSFPTSSIPAILFLNFADDALRRWPLPKNHCASRTFSWRLRLCSQEENATLPQLCGDRWRKLRSRSSRSRHEVSPRLARQCGSEEKQRVQANRDQIFKSSSTKFAHLVAKARWSVRRKGDWKEIVKLKAKYSILELPACAAAVSFAATLFAGVDLQGSDGRGASQLPICADTLFFCSTNVRWAKTNICDRSKRTFTERSVDSFQLLWQKCIIFSNLHAFFQTVNLLLHLCFQTDSSFFFLSLGPDIAHLYAVNNFLFAVPSTQTPQFAKEVHGLLHLSKISSTLIFKGIICYFFHGDGYFMVSCAVFSQKPSPFSKLIGCFSNEQNTIRANNHIEHNLQHLTPLSGKLHLNSTLYDELQPMTDDTRKTPRKPS